MHVRLQAPWGDECAVSLYLSDTVGDLRARARDVLGLDVLPSLSYEMDTLTDDSRRLCDVGLSSDEVIRVEEPVHVLALRRLESIGIRGVSEESLRRHAARHDYDVVRLLVETGLVSGRRVLVQAMGDVDHFLKLLDCGFRIDILNGSSDENGLLHAATRDAQELAIKALISRGADVNQRNTSGATPLHIAALYGYIPALNLLLEHGADAQCKTTDGDTPMHYAARFGHLPILTLLHTQAPGTIDAANHLGLTPLHVAVENGCCSTVRTLCDLGADVCAKSAAGATPLHLACVQGEVDVVKALIFLGADVNAAMIIDGATPMHVAAGSGRTEAINILRFYNAHVDDVDSAGCTPALRAAQSGHAETLLALHDAGADVTTCDAHGRSALHHAALHNRVAVFDLFRQQPPPTAGGGSSSSSLSTAVSATPTTAFTATSGSGPTGMPVPFHGHAGMLASHSAGSLVHVRNATFASSSSVTTMGVMSMTSVASGGGCSGTIPGGRTGGDAAVDLSAESRAMLLRPDAGGMTPMHVAAAEGHVASIVALKQLGMDICVKGGPRGATPMHLAARHGRREALRVLLESGGDIEALDTAAQTPLHYAAREGRLESIQALKHLGVTIDAEDDACNTPLHLAVTHGQAVAVRGLLHSGANAQAVNKKGQTPADIAQMHRFMPALEAIARIKERQLNPLSPRSDARSDGLSSPSRSGRNTGGDGDGGCCVIC